MVLVFTYGVSVTYELNAMASHLGLIAVMSGALLLAKQALLCSEFCM
jgi:hypothetical protein